LIISHSFGRHICGTAPSHTVTPTLPSAEHARQFEKIRRDAFIGLAPETRPRAVFTSGQPGSGKSMIAAQAMKELGYNAVRIDADELRSYHKDYLSCKQPA
jgi:adenylylsulfate kinase-like enzyme